MTNLLSHIATVVDHHRSFQLLVIYLGQIFLQNHVLSKKLITTMWKSCVKLCCAQTGLFKLLCDHVSSFYKQVVMFKDRFNV